MMGGVRIVLDTNVWLDWLLFADPRVAPLRARVERGEDEIVIDAACEAELERVLGYRFYGEKLPPERQRECLEQLRRFSRRISVCAGQRIRLPRCKDADDQKFLELAAAAGAECLVTKDLALLRLARGALPFRIIGIDALPA